MSADEAVRTDQDYAAERREMGCIVPWPVFCSAHPTPDPRHIYDRPRQTHIAYRLRALADYHERQGTGLQPEEMRALAIEFDYRDA